jgi:hypothetical protein
MKRIRYIVLISGVVGGWLSFAVSQQSQPATQPTTRPASRPAGDVDYWLGRAKSVETQPTQTKSAESKKKQAVNPLARQPGFNRADALPGVIELSDGRQLPGGIFTTRDKPWLVWLAGQKRWRQIPPLAVLSITAVVDQEEMKLQWRWKAMGEPEKVYTGEKYPFRRFRWKFHLADDSYITGAIKGQPVWVASPTASNTTAGPFVLHERSKGKARQTLKDLVYVKKIVISRTMMDKVIAAQQDKQKTPAKTAPVR